MCWDLNSEPFARTQAAETPTRFGAGGEATVLQEPKLCHDPGSNTTYPTLLLPPAHFALNHHDSKNAHPMYLKRVLFYFNCKLYTFFNEVKPFSLRSKHIFIHQR